MALQVTLASGKIVVLRELSAAQQLDADIIAAASSRTGVGGFSSSYYRIAAAIEKINEEVFGEFRTDLDLEVRIDQFEAEEQNQLLDVWNEHCTPKRKIDAVNGFVTTTSGKVFALKKIRAREQLSADRCADEAPVAFPYYRLAAALWGSGKTAEGQPEKVFPVPELSDPKPELARRIGLLSAFDYAEIASNILSNPAKADVKNV